jgi:hypothetical protein
LKWNNGEEEWKPRDDGKDYDHEDKREFSHPGYGYVQHRHFFLPKKRMLQSLMG